MKTINNFFRKTRTKQNIKPQPINRTMEDKRIFFDFLLNIDKDFNEDFIQQGLFFENFICSLYKLAGYKAYVTDKTNDNGIDVIVELSKNEHLYIQCKNYRLNTKAPNLVKSQDILSFNGTVGSHKKIFITTSFFQGSFNKNSFPDITFIDRKELFRLIHNLVPDLFFEYAYLISIKDYDIHECPKCQDGVITKKYSPKTKQYFNGCSNYPKCK